MSVQKSQNRAQKLAAKIAMLEAQLDHIKAEEKSKVRAAAAKELTRAAKRSGILALLRGGMVATEKLEAEFIVLVERLKEQQPVEPVVNDTVNVQEPSTGEENQRKSFWAR